MLLIGVALSNLAINQPDSYPEKSSWVRISTQAIFSFCGVDVSCAIRLERNKKQLKYSV